MSFTDQKARIATEKDIKGRWGGGNNGKYFRCYLCGHKFQLGDYWRWVFGGGYHLNNIIVCQDCDGPDVMQRWKDMMHEAKTKYWWFIKEEY